VKSEGKDCPEAEINLEYEGKTNLKQEIDLKCEGNALKTENQPEVRALPEETTRCRESIARSNRKSECVGTMCSVGRSVV
jgi:hypothetical protein